MILCSGTPEERGLAAWAREMQLDAGEGEGEGDRPADTYDFPIGMTYIRR